MQSHISILHVDDDPSVLEITEQVARRHDGLEIRSTTDPTDALGSLGDVDCVVSDSVRTADGDLFVAAARRHDPDVPIVLFTAKDWQDVLAEARESAAAGYVRKGDADAFEELFDRVAAVAGPAAESDDVFEIPDFQGDDGWTIVDRYDPAADDELAVWLVDAVDRHTRYDALDCPPIFDIVDPEALEELIETATDIAVGFRYLDYQIGLNADGDLAIRSA